MNFSRAWEISRSVPWKEHNVRCSAYQCEHGMLCDCEVLTTHPEYVAEYGDEKPDRPLRGRWEDGKWVLND